MGINPNITNPHLLSYTSRGAVRSGPLFDRVETNRPQEEQPVETPAASFQRLVDTKI
jgi:hypothetical protein